MEALRDPANAEKYHGDEQMWTYSERFTREAVGELDETYEVCASRTTA